MDRHCGLVLKPNNGLEFSIECPCKGSVRRKLVDFFERFGVQFWDDSTVHHGGCLNIGELI